MVYTVEIKNINEMEIFAQEVAKHLFPGFVLCLAGDLGAGKTTFTQFLGKHMGINDSINSPTFTIMKNYEHKPYSLTHIDAYRLEGVKRDMEVEEYIYSNGVSVIEWYTYIEESLPDEYLSIHIAFISEHERHLTIEGRGKYEKIAKSISHR
ncbi:MAG: tRNA (adenosine(37)-N6)-threonylcarbamoyltransferase complex ATPase subunit type 1 TsaE [Candidatus Izemoplasmataceae bacterium]|uniref:tRNA (adenosine(37)-N6)-threonylcarbamoyltransferase complex ATPase subunit type 1 TsaE n=1 Tax=Liberiplasma polymorphum TaxID=3374570 RepID=UPI00377134F1